MVAAYTVSQPGGKLVAAYTVSLLLGVSWSQLILYRCIIVFIWLLCEGGFVLSSHDAHKCDTSENGGFSSRRKFSRIYSVAMVIKNHAFHSLTFWSRDFGIRHACF